MLAFCQDASAGNNRRGSVIAATTHKMSVVQYILHMMTDWSKADTDKISKKNQIWGIGRKYSQINVKLRKVSTAAHPQNLPSFDRWLSLLWMITWYSLEVFLLDRVSGRPVLGSAPVLRLLRQAEERKYSHPTGGGKHPTLHCTGPSDGAELILRS